MVTLKLYLTDSTVSVANPLYNVLEVQQNLRRYVRCDISFDLSLSFFILQSDNVELLYNLH